MNDDIPLGLSFDDVLVLPGLSEILPGEADISTRLTKDIGLNIPIISSAMDTVTEATLAIALAREGGIGVVHRNCPVDEQAEHVLRVKRSENAVIQDPLTVSSNIPMQELRQVMERHGVSGFPVVDGHGILEGMVTSRDMWNVADDSTKVAEIMTPRDRLITGKADTELDEALKILARGRIEKLPLIDEAGKLTGLITRQDIEKRHMFGNACKDPQGRLRVGGAIGVGPDWKDRAQALIQVDADGLFIDAATGHTSRVVELIGQIKSNHSDVVVVAGNVVTEQGAKDLVSAGADAVKIGVGPGSICTTRVISGVGMPQFTAIRAVTDHCRAHDVVTIADGGIRYSGDIVKALAAGADCVMLGSLLAGTKESPGAMVKWQGRSFKEYRGMGSLKAMRKGSGDRYGQNASGKLVAEGVEARVPYKGPLAEMVFQLLGGLRSGMGYVGARSLDELRAKAQFTRITAGGLRESHPHDIVITEEPVNYQSP